MMYATTPLRLTAAVLLLSTAAVSAAACAPRPPVEDSAPAFALTSADAVIPDDRVEYPLNFIFMAPEGDTIWTDLTGLTFGEFDFAPGEFSVTQGEGTDGYLLGNLSVEITPPDTAVTFDTVELFYDGLTEPRTSDVGSWTITTAPAEEFATTTAGAEVAAIAGCTSANLPVAADVTAVSDVTTGVPDVETSSVEFLPEERAVRIGLDCIDTADFYIISPSATLTTGGTDTAARFAPIAIGYQDIDDEDLQRIRSRVG
ncbi:hypothetical protein [Microbacterium sp. NPDC077184]|uniref:hypothetical protein n=1 Tax=Microbacterium sp. NPDC077184 TaxID=3154764 RepID=UPI0034416089